ncbi:MAG: type IV pilus secretin PilQ, partial [Myxococcota bacterium]
ILASSDVQPDSAAETAETAETAESAETVEMAGTDSPDSAAMSMLGVDPPMSDGPEDAVADEEAIEAEPTVDGEALAASELASSEPEAEALTEATGESELVTIYGVEFDSQDARDRLVILGDAPVDYLVYEPDEDTLILSMSRAEIEPEAAVRIAPEHAGPVSLITAFAQPDVESAEVRVVVKRAAGTQPEIFRRGSLLVVDFPRTGAVAARPPVMDLPETELASADDSGSSLADFESASAPAPAAIAPSREDAETGLSAAGGAPASLEPPASIELLQEGGLIDGKEYAGRRISLDFKEVDIADVLRLIAEVSDLNVIAGDEVKGKVTIRLVDVPWDQALDIILLTKGLGFMRIGNVLRIAPNDVLAQEEEARLQERRAKERLEDLVVKLQPVNYADAREVSGMVKELLTERGTVNVDKRTNTLILKDIASVIDEATALIKAIDTQTPQVMIEAKVVEAKLSFSREFGSVWAVGVQPFNDPFDDSSGLRRSVGGNLARFRPNPSTDVTNGAVFANPITAGPTALANLGAFLLDDNINLDLQLQAAEVNGDGKVISSPRVVTMDNSKAKIEQGVSIPFQTFENGDAQLEFVDAVLKLEVTPHITANNAIIMKVKVTRNAPDDSVFTLTGSPAIAKNEVDTETLVKDGQTLVLGGIYTVSKSQRQSRVPYLHSIPILGGLFRNNEISDDRQELLIFVTPRVVQSEQTAS